ncbi:hypothetical protein CRG98_041122 [Punica granatum]|uniref:Uncharacterized protein n=1 Tax=Punica granatum TaxID=22663 RepID=A0A2I0I3B0_PUNGR|nr:hypothetical protein CRG98_041122 [Punica granatum]
MKIERGGGVGVADRRPRTPNRTGTSRRSPVDSGFEPPIDDPDPSTEVASTYRGRWRPRWKGRGRRLAARTPNRPRTFVLSPFNSGFGVADWLPRPLLPFRFSFWIKMKQNRKFRI